MFFLQRFTILRHQLQTLFFVCKFVFSCKYYMRLYFPCKQKSESLNRKEPCQCKVPVFYRFTFDHFSRRKNSWFSNLLILNIMYFTLVELNSLPSPEHSGSCELLSLVPPLAIVILRIFDVFACMQQPFTLLNISNAAQSAAVFSSQMRFGCFTLRKLGDFLS